MTAAERDPDAAPLADLRTATEAHDRINTLLDRISALTRQLDSAHEMNATVSEQARAALAHRDAIFAELEAERARNVTDRVDRGAYETCSAERDQALELLNETREEFARVNEHRRELAGKLRRETDRVDEVAAELETALRQRDAAAGMVANLRGVLHSIVTSIDGTELK